MEKSNDNEFIIPFVGLKQGKHVFEFDITDAFFDTFEYSIIQKGKVHIEFTLDKKDTMMVGEFQVEGSVETSCDRCNDSIEVPIEGEFRLVYKFDNKESEDEALVIIYPEEYELHIKDTLLEFMTVLLPIRTIHPQGECNEEMMQLLNEYLITSLDEDEDDEDLDDEEYDDDYDDEEYDDDDFDDDLDSDDDNDDDEPDDDRPIDPRWGALSQLNMN